MHPSSSHPLSPADGSCTLHKDARSPPGALHVNNPNYSRTTRDSGFYYTSALRYLRSRTEPIDEAERWVKMLLFAGHRRSDLVELPACRSRRSMLVGGESTKGTNSGQRSIYSPALPGSGGRFREEALMCCLNACNQR